MSIPAASALAGTDELGDQQYQGKVEKTQDSYFGFDKSTSNGMTRISHISAFIDYTCANDTEGGEIYAEGKGSLRVRHGRFAGTLKTKNFLGRGSVTVNGTYRVSGQLLKKGKAKGRIDAVLHINQSSMRGGGPMRCYSGRVDWKAKRGAHTFPIN